MEQLQIVQLLRPKFGCGQWSVLIVQKEFLIMVLLNCRERKVFISITFLGISKCSELFIQNKN